MATHFNAHAEPAAILAYANELRGADRIRRILFALEVMIAGGADTRPFLALFERADLVKISRALLLPESDGHRYYRKGELAEHIVADITKH